MIAAVLIRGFIGMDQEVKDTLQMLNMKRKHVCVLLESNKINLGMLNKVKDYVAYGEVDDETVKALKSKSKKGFYQLQPPKGGFERGGIKKSYKQGGALGNRGKEMSALIKRMI